ncbi:MAG: MFS transporter, partial [Candidatus Thermoplasmatota archaeon]
MKKRKLYGYLVVIAAFLAVFTLFGYRSSFGVLLGPMSDDMGWTVSQTTLGYALMMLVYGVSAYFSGEIVDRWGVKYAYLLGAIFGALGFLLSSLVNSYEHYLASYAIFGGIGTGMCWVTSTASVRKWYPGSKYATYWGLAFMGAPTAQVLMSLGASEVIIWIGWRYAMRMLAAV